MAIQRSTIIIIGIQRRSSERAAGPMRKGRRTTLVASMGIDVMLLAVTMSASRQPQAPGASECPLGSLNFRSRASPLNRFQLAACGGGEIVEKGLELFDGERRFEELSGVESSS
jgi:hypothetical protein